MGLIYRNLIHSMGIPSTVRTTGLLSHDLLRPKGLPSRELLVIMLIFPSLLSTYGRVIESGELVSYGRYFSPFISHLIWYVTPRDGNVEMIIELRTSIQIDISVRKTKFISELPPCTKNIKKEELSL